MRLPQELGWNQKWPLKLSWELPLPVKRDQWPPMKKCSLQLLLPLPVQRD